MAGDPSRILVISLRRIGDLLLTTPLIRSLRRAWPTAGIDVLVFANTAGLVEGNPDFRRVQRLRRAPSSARVSGGSTTSQCPRRAVTAPRHSRLPRLRSAPA